MGALIAGILGGASSAYANHLDQQRADKKQLTDEERQTHLNDYNNTLTTLQTNMQAAREAGDTTSLNNYQTQHDQVIKDRTALFHPDNGPGGLAMLGKMVWDKVHGSTAPPSTSLAPDSAVQLPVAGTVQQVALPAVADTGANGLPAQGGQMLPAAPAVNLPAMPGAGPVIPASSTPGPTVTERPATKQDAATQYATDMSYNTPAPTPNALLLKAKRMQAAGYTPEEIKKSNDIDVGLAAKPVGRIPSGQYELVSGTMNGQKVSFQRSKYDGSFTDLNGNPVGPDALTNFVPDSKAVVHPPTQSRQLVESYAKQLGKKPEDLTFDELNNMNGLVAQAKAGNTSRDVTSFQVINGQITPVTVRDTTHKSFNATPIPPAATVPPGTTVPSSQPAPAAGAPATPGALKRSAAATVKPKGGSGLISVGAPIGEKPTAAQGKADQDVIAATKLDSLANRAVASKDPGQQRQLALALIKAMAGRVNMQEYGIYTKGYGVANTVDGLIQGITNGGLSPGVLEHLVNDAHANLAASKDAQVESRKSFGAANSNASVDDILKALGGK